MSLEHHATLREGGSAFFPARLRVVALAAACLAAAAPGFAAGVSEKPNIVFILADDLGWRDLHADGHPWHETPHLDRLAREGTRFTQGYAAAPICSASRVALLTGRSPARLLAPAGYATGYFGKWHVSEHTGSYLGWSATHGPLQQGYAEGDSDFGNHPYAYVAQPALKSAPLAPGDYGRDTLTEKAIAFLGARRTGPFFLHLGHYFVHDPIHTRAAWLVEKYRARCPPGTDPRRIEYAAMVETLDHHVGQLLRALDDLGLRKNTLVVFTSDNGGHPVYSSHGPLRGSKWNLYEAGVRVPWLVRWPGQVPPDTTSAVPFIGTDLMPTLAAAAAATLPAGVSLDGRNMLPVWRGGGPPPERELVWHFPYYHPETGFEAARGTIGVDDF
ncbi:MAG: sulfatase-like hydrolase/transferase, partial [Verrucomicrobia bacterium]|nr:sulfatase-like hydrolase/transferase [Verrucomicrobiota bacterium]